MSRRSAPEQDPGARVTRDLVLAVGTRNKCKVTAVRAVAALNPALSGATVIPYSVHSGIPEQPLTLEITRTGAINRARAAFTEAKNAGSSTVLAVGIESGLFQPDGDTGRAFDVCVCMATEDGESFNMGLSCAFEIPAKLMECVRQGMDLAQACNACKITSDPHIGEHGGLIGILSNGRVTRQAYTEQALQMALLFLENRELYVRNGSEADAEESS